MRRSSGRHAHEYGDLLYEKGDGIAKISINRPEVRNAFRPQTLAELRDAFNRARDDTEVGSIIFTGAGDRGVLLGRRPADPRRRRLHRRRRGGPEGRRAPRRGRPPRADPAPAEAGRRDGRGLRGRRRAHPPPRLRPDDRRRERALRPDRAAGGLVRRRLRRVAPRQQHRRQARQGDLVPLPPLRRGRGARDGPREHGRAGGRSSSARRSPGVAR